MPHVILLGDSIFDNAAYTEGGPDVISQVIGLLPPGWDATLLAVDGAKSDDVADQIRHLPADATHLVLSVGGNDALGHTSVLDSPASSTAQVLGLLADIAIDFEKRYRAAVEACLSSRLPLSVCTIYNGCFPDPAYQRLVSVALMMFNDPILRLAIEHHLAVIDLRQICSDPQDYANPIEPSSVGGAKIARAIVAVLAGSWLGAQAAASLPSAASKENAARLAAAFEGRQAVYVEKGILMVKVDGIAAHPTESSVSAYVTELPTPGMPYHGQGGSTSPIRFKIDGGYLTSFSAHQWHMGYGGWTLYFDAGVLASVKALAESLPRDTDWSERYQKLLDCIQREGQWAPNSKVFE